ncbi:MAG: FKBP-type peptidyl-prolyl cis-trans isomerase [Lewinella sp.]|nr:FKBP-type peptidyl-prolyl cis-trans isomerase [Lewinella sp.]
MVVVDVKSEADFQAEQSQKQAEAEAEAETIRARAPQVLAAAKDMVAKYAAGELAGQVQRTGTGLGYIIEQEGSGPMPEAGRAVSVQYAGLLTDGTVFDNSFERGSPIQFPLGVGRVIPGWDEGIALLKEGGSGYLFIPHQLGYGEAGSPPVIPGNAELVFFVELIKAN